MHKFLCAMSLGLTAILPASLRAADLAPLPRVQTPSTYNWTGLYFGLNGGYGWGRQDPFNIITNRFDKLSTNISGGVFGVTSGAQIQVASVVIGFESDIDWSGIGGSRSALASVAGVPIGLVRASTDARWEGTARARLGYASSNWLFYATGGLALLGTKTSLTNAAGAPAICGAILPNCSGTNRQVGAALGAGVEYGFTQNLSAKFEYLYLSAASLETSSHSELRAGLNYRFGGF